MALSRRTKLVLAMPAFVIIGLPALVLWGAGWIIMFTGQNLWMICHRRLREPGCACEECVQFDGAKPKTSAVEPPAAA
jgi:hypothetical protein